MAVVQVEFVLIQGIGFDAMIKFDTGIVIDLRFVAMIRLDEGEFIPIFVCHVQIWLHGLVIVRLEMPYDLFFFC